MIHLTHNQSFCVILLFLATIIVIIIKSDCYFETDQRLRQHVEMEASPLLLNTAQTTKALSKPPNYAPQMKIDASLCDTKALWGRPHAGGWNICSSLVPKSEQDAKDVPTVPNCIVYSYGLGADWSFDNHAESMGCEVHGFDPSGLLWRQGMHGAEYSNIDYAKDYPSKMKVFHCIYCV